MSGKAAKRVVLVLTILSAVFSGVALRAAQRPNIVWIFSDDHAYQAIGAYGGHLADENLTPNLDTIAREGMLFERAYVGNSICAPSRATLLTGKHSHKNGKFTNGGPFDHDQQQFQKILRQHGYQTAMIGKIHLSGAMQGFDYWEVLPGQGRYINPQFITETGRTEYKGHSTDIITDRALNWLENGADTSRPFMLMVHYKAPHRNWQPAERIAEKFRQRTFPEPDNLFDDYSERGTAAHKQDMSIEKTMRMRHDLKVVPGSKRAEYLEKHQPEGRDLIRWKYQAYMQDYLGCIAGVDENVGRILNYLKESGREKNTVVMYSSDQGFYLGEHGWFDKRFMYEESFRTPLLARWPGVIKPGQRNRDLVQNIDFAETFLDIAGAPIPDDMQGRSIVPLLKGNRPHNWRASLYYHYYEYPAVHSVRRHEGVFNGRYKLIRFYGMDVPNGEEWELFDVKNDPSEMQSIYHDPEMAGTIQILKAELDRLRKLYEVPENGGLDIVRKRRKSGGSSAEKDKLNFSFPKGIVPSASSPYLVGRAIELTAKFNYANRDGVLVAQGGASHGYALWIKDGCPQWSIARDDKVSTVSANKKLAPGKQILMVTQTKTGSVTIKSNGNDLATGKVPGAFIEQPLDSLSVGMDSGSQVTSYGRAKAYPEELEPVVIRLTK